MRAFLIILFSIFLLAWEDASSSESGHEFGPKKGHSLDSGTEFWDFPQISPNHQWSQISSNSEYNVAYLIEVLKKSPMGRTLIYKAIRKAAEQGNRLSDVILPGSHSITDTTLLRRFKPSNPFSVHYESKAEVRINKDYPVKHAVLDLAHELVHFVYRDHFNPYRESYTLDYFIRSTIEDDGGEAHALVTECLVTFELFGQEVWKRPGCKAVFSKGKFQRVLAIRGFYQVGDHYSKLTRDYQRDYGQDMKVVFPLISPDKPLFISSAYGLPYPLAAYSEFHSVLTKACSNDKERLLTWRRSANINKPQTLAERLKSGRSLASEPSLKFERSFTRRCAKVLSSSAIQTSR